MQGTAGELYCPLRRNPRLITLRSSLHHMMERGTKSNQPWVPTMYCPGPQEIEGIEHLPAPRGKELCLLTSQTLNNSIIVDYCYFYNIFCDGLLHSVILYDNQGALRSCFNLDFYGNTFGTLSAMIPVLNL